MSWSCVRDRHKTYEERREEKYKNPLNRKSEVTETSEEDEIMKMNGENDTARSHEMKREERKTASKEGRAKGERKARDRN